MSEAHICFRMLHLTSIRHGNRFQQSNVTFMEVLFLTYDIVYRDPPNII